jgi:hypothetical protein
MNYKIVGWIFFSLISLAIKAAEVRSEIKFEALPAAVRVTVSRFIDQDKITKIERVTDADYVKFAIQSIKTDNNKVFVDTDMIVASDGAIIKMAKQAPYFDIPFPVMNQLSAHYPDLKVDEVEAVQVRYFHLTGKNKQQPINIKLFDDGEIQELPVDDDKKP